MKLILDIDPKTPGESLAKELRQVTKTYYHNTIHLCWKYRHFDSSLANETSKCLVKQLSTEQRFSMYNIEFLNCFYKMLMPFQVRLTVERVTCEKKELEHQLFENRTK